jgi:hypothetical protein
VNNIIFGAYWFPEMYRARLDLLDYLAQEKRCPWPAQLQTARANVEAEMEVLRKTGSIPDDDMAAKVRFLMSAKRILISRTPAPMKMSKMLSLRLKSEFQAFDGKAFRRKKS